MRVSVGLAWAAFAWCLTVGTALVFLNTYAGETCGPEGCVSTSATLIEVNGTQVLAALAIPIVLAMGCLGAILAGASRWLQWLPVGLLAGFCFLAMFSIGLAYLPAALLLFFAVATNGAPGPDKEESPT